MKNVANLSLLRDHLENSKLEKMRFIPAAEVRRKALPAFTFQVRTTRILPLSYSLYRKVLSPMLISCTIGDTTQHSELITVNECKRDQRKREKIWVGLGYKPQENRGCSFLYRGFT